MAEKETPKNQKKTNKVRRFLDYFDTDNGNFYKQAGSFYRVLSTIILLASALALIVYEIFIFVHDAYNARWEGICPKQIFYALILSTTSLAFVGMHYVINILIKKEHGSKVHGNNDCSKELRWQDFAIFFSLMLCSVLLAGLIITYKHYFP